MEHTSRAEIPSPHLVHEMFELRMKEHPDAIAVSYKGRQLSYRELNERSQQLARYLIRRGARCESRVAICVERSLEMVIGLLGILKAGAAYVPLDPSYPIERLRYIIEDCQADLLLTQEHLRATLPPVDIPKIELDADLDLINYISGTDSDEATVKLNPKNLAYVIYTSGSTGAPKGVMVEHGNVTQFLAAVNEWFHFRPGDTWALFHSFAFDVSVMELWGALASGGKLIVVSYATTRFPRDLHALLSAEAVSVLCQTPSAFRRLIAAQASCFEPLSLRTILLAGEALQVRSLKPWYERETNREVFIANMYGPTETTVYVTYQPVHFADEDSPGGSVIGVPLKNSRISIFDSRSEPIQAGAAGEIHIGGTGVARGYLNRPDLTAERFIADPKGVEGARMYRSGDLGSWQPDGKIEYRGRNDSQVKVRGFRIELGEIEHHLAAIDGIREAIVKVSEDSPGEARLVAYLTENEGAGLTTPVIRRELLRRLPVHMVPTDFIILPQMPLNGSGKIDRKALPLPAPPRTLGVPTTHSSTHIPGEQALQLSSPESSIHSTTKICR